ncbi:MAG: SDR family oxidoreductase [Candidatus Eisenbacteria bacterium]|nr:SDR family oxidoreductase [Candidatus Eisenbacteria bacterium]
MSENDLQGKVALVTGGARGLGEAICSRLAREGVHVVVGDVRNDLTEGVVSRIRESGTGGTAVAASLDLRDARQVEEVVRRVSEEMGGIDILVNNAGADRTVPIDELSVEEFDSILAVNLRAPFLLARQILPGMRAKGGGHIINIVSTAARRAWANASAYHASKWGLLGLSHAMHVEGRPHGVRVSAVICGGMRTPFLLDRFPEIDVTTLQDPRNVADAIVFLLRQPEGTVIPEMMVLPMKETSWP